MQVSVRSGVTLLVALIVQSLLACSATAFEPKAITTEGDAMLRVAECTGIDRSKQADSSLLAKATLVDTVFQDMSSVDGYVAGMSLWRVHIPGVLFCQTEWNASPEGHDFDVWIDSADGRLVRVLAKKPGAIPAGAPDPWATLRTEPRFSGKFNVHLASKLPERSLMDIMAAVGWARASAAAEIDIALTSVEWIGPGPKRSDTPVDGAPLWDIMLRFCSFRQSAEQGYEITEYSQRHRIIDPDNGRATRISEWCWPPQ